MDRRTELFYGSIFHDIGKLIQRGTSERKRHSELGSTFLEEFSVSENIRKQVALHHIRDLKDADLEKDDLTYITYIADNIASGVDRRHTPERDESTYQNWDALTNLKDIFNLFRVPELKSSPKSEERFYQAFVLDDRKDIQFATEKNRHFSPGEYNGIIERVKGTLRNIKFTKEYIPSILNLFEATMSYVPSSTNLSETNDVSLYDHSKMTCAFAMCIYSYLEEQGITDYRSLVDEASIFYDEDAFLLLSFDISGIQDFIYTITDAKAAKTLRSRSFYLEILAENLIDQIIYRLNLSRANLLYSGGGHAYLLIANTVQAQTTVKEIEKEINEFLRDKFGVALYISFGSSPFSASNLFLQQSQVGEIYQATGRSISENKLSRYSSEDILNLNAKGKKTGRECSACHQIEADVEDVCSFCQGLRDFSAKLQCKDFFLVSKEETALPLGFGQYLQAIDESEITEELQGTIYAKNKFYSGKNQNTHLWIGYYTDRKEYSDYAKEAKGIERLAVVRCDVDNLGLAFIKGFADDYNSFSRSATFSRNMTLFFKYHINHIMKNLEVSGTIIYAGGDDVFVLGEWSDMLRFAIALRKDFIRFTQGKLTLSTGIGIFPAKTPVRIMAEQTGILESAAKDNGKDSVSLFAPQYTYKWDHFLEEILGTKYELVSNYFGKNFADAEKAEQGKAFIYRLIQLIRESFIELDGLTRGEFKTISWARWVYALSRIEPKEEKAQAAFKEFSRQIHEYFKSETDARELEFVLMLYVYSIRGK